MTGIGDGEGNDCFSVGLELAIPSLALSDLDFSGNQGKGLLEGLHHLGRAY